MLKEFKEFALRGNVLDLAVAVILGVAFGTVISSFVNDVLMAAIGGLLGQPNFGALSFEVGGAAVAYGAFLNTVVNFIAVAFALFLVVKAVNRARRGGRPREEAPSVRECPFCLSSIPSRASRCSACTAEVEPAA
jgi:large conductance mechanosensitive channel